MAKGFSANQNWTMKRGYSSGSSAKNGPPVTHKKPPSPPQEPHKG